jgi:2-polyprenyl-6-methoxyphenol hydroxylase-like FAD-dependent oxidoreductase
MLRWLRWLNRASNDTFLSMVKAARHDVQWLADHSFPERTAMSFDTVIIGAGTVGRCLAGSPAGTGLCIAPVERQRQASLTAPADDGREIAITHKSQRLMRELGRLLSNLAIRRVACAGVMELPEVERITGAQVSVVRTASDDAKVELSTGDSCARN